MRGDGVVGVSSGGGVLGGRHCSGDLWIDEEETEKEGREM